MKVSEKGAVSVYGLGRFPVTLYQEQWLKLLDLAEDIRAFIKENEPRLKKKE
jgi:predicted component of type VI protein secretion system